MRRKREDETTERKSTRDNNRNVQVSVLETFAAAKHDVYFCRIMVSYKITPSVQGTKVQHMCQKWHNTALTDGTPSDL